MELDLDLRFNEQVQHIWQSYFRFFGVIYPFLDSTAWIGGVTTWPLTSLSRRVVGTSRSQESEKKWLFAMVDFAIASLTQERSAILSPGQESSSSSAASNEHYTWPWIDQTRPRPFKSRVPEWISRQEPKIPTPCLPFNRKLVRMTDKKHQIRQNQLMSRNHSNSYYNQQIPVQVSKRIGASRYFQSRGSNVDNLVQLHPPLRKNFAPFPARRYRQIDWNSIQNHK